MDKVHVLIITVLIAVLGICHVTARSLPYSSRVKRISSDQRMAELQALLSMAYRPSAVVGHGVVDTYNAGKRKRSYMEETRKDGNSLADILNRLDLYLNQRSSL